MEENNELFIFDSSALLDTYRFSLVTSKTLLNYIKEVESKIWIPYQVKLEVENNMGKTKNISMYSNLEKKFNSYVDNRKRDLKNDISNYSKYELPDISNLLSNVEKHLENIKQDIKKYRNELKEQEDLYKDYILGEVDKYFNDLLASDKVGECSNIVELLEIYQEGELRYRYEIPPGYKDCLKNDKSKFGDLIVWKQILKYTQTLNSSKIIFITSDTKEDWFIDNRPRKELIEEFKVYNPNKEINIIPTPEFIEQNLTSGNHQNKNKILIELNKNKFIEKIEPHIVIDKIENYLDNVVDLKEWISNYNFPIEKNSNLICTEVSEDLEILSSNVTFDENKAIYGMNLKIEVTFHCSQFFEEYISNDELILDATILLKIERPIDSSEREALELLLENYSGLVTVDNITFQGVKVTHISKDIINRNLFNQCQRCFRYTIFDNSEEIICSDCKLVVHSHQ